MNKGFSLNRIKRIYPGVAMLLTVLMLSGCANPFAPGNTEVVTEDVSPTEEYRPGSEGYVTGLADSMDERAVVVSVNSIESTMKFYNLSAGRTYTLSYNGLTNVKNKFDEQIVPGQLREGDVARVTFLKDSRLVKSVSLLQTDSISVTAESAPLNLVADTSVIDEEDYKIVKNVPILSGGREIAYEEINPVDMLRLESIDKEILSVTVENGHGYVRLAGHEMFQGGWVEVGTTIAPVEEEMLLSVPEGKYDLCISKDNTQGIRPITVYRDQETVVDLSDLQTEQIKKTGKVIFTIKPETAKLYIDGKETDYSEEIELIYGVHQMTARAEGYTGLTQYFKVGQEVANLNVELTKSDKDEEEGSEKTISANTASTATSPSQRRVFVDAPNGAELYVNGSYIGVIPTSFPKKEGTYVISVRKQGYETRSYTLQIDDSDKDQTYSFSELEETYSGEEEVPVEVPELDKSKLYE